jgi:hypothetical protein
LLSLPGLQKVKGGCDVFRVQLANKWPGEKTKKPRRATTTNLPTIQQPVCRVALAWLLSRKELQKGKGRLSIRDTHFGFAPMPLPPNFSA